jgi:ABC-type nitrate/sulfonate/bicarbonate transport system substrate-binding protein
MARSSPNPTAANIAVRLNDLPSYAGRGRAVFVILLTLVLLGALLCEKIHALDTVRVGIPTKSFQHVIYLLAQERNYMQQEGINLEIVLIAPTTSIQALLTGDLHFTLSGTSALIANHRAGVPVKVVLAANHQVLQWLLAKSGVSDVKALKNKRIATPGLASMSTLIVKQILSKHGLNPNSDVVMIDSAAGAQLKSVLSGVADAAILGAEQRYFALDSGLKDLAFLGREVKNSWGTLATSDRLIKEQPALVRNSLRATLKALRFIRANKEVTVAAMAKFSKVERDLAGRVYDDLISTFTTDGTVDEETQRNDVAVIRQVIGATEPMAITRGYDFSLARAADRELTQSGWRP